MTTTPLFRETAGTRNKSLAQRAAPLSWFPVWRTGGAEEEALYRWLRRAGNWLGLPDGRAPGAGIFVGRVDVGRGLRNGGVVRSRPPASSVTAAGDSQPAGPAGDLVLGVAWQSGWMKPG